MSLACTPAPALPAVLALLFLWRTIFRGFRLLFVLADVIPQGLQIN
jgi:hypothetical protein